MPILPQYDGVSTRIATPDSPAAPTDRRPEQIYRLGQALERSSAQVNEAYKRRKELEDEAEVMRRYMQAVTEMEGLTNELHVPDNALKAKELFDTHVSERENEWYKDLSPSAQQKLQQKLFGRTLEYRTGAHKIEHRAKLQQYSATLVDAKTRYADVSSRYIADGDATDTPEWQMFAEGIDAGVRAGFMSAEEGAKEKDAARKQGAASRVYKVTASESQEEVQRLLDLYKKEDAEPGSTFLKHIDPFKRVELQKQAQERLNSLKAEQARQEREAKRDTKEMNDELTKATAVMAAQKLAEPEKYGRLTRDWIDQAADLRLMDRPEYEHFRKAIESVEASGTATGYGNPAVLNRFSTAVYTTTTPQEAQQVRQELIAQIAAGNVPAGPGSIGSQWLNHLEEKTKVPGNTPPSMSQQTNDVQEVLKIALAVTGPFQFDQTSNAVKDEAFRMLAKNAAAGYPVSPWEIFEKNIDNWQSRAGVPAKRRSSELRRSQGLKPAADPKTAAETIEEHRLGLQKRYLEAPPGPEGDAQRQAIKEAARSLNNLRKLEEEMARVKALREQSRGQQGGAQSSSGSSQQKPQQSSGGSIPPVPTGTRR